MIIDGRPEFGTRPSPLSLAELHATYASLVTLRRAGSTNSSAQLECRAALVDELIADVAWEVARRRSQGQSDALAKARVLLDWVGDKKRDLVDQLSASLCNDLIELLPNVLRGRHENAEADVMTDVTAADDKPMHNDAKRLGAIDVASATIQPPVSRRISIPAPACPSVPPGRGGESVGRNAK